MQPPGQKKNFRTQTKQPVTVIFRSVSTLNIYIEMDGVL